MSTQPYSLESVVGGLKGILQQYLESQYHVWDESLVDERRLLLEAHETIAQTPYIEATPFYERMASYAVIDIPSAARDVLSKCSEIAGTGVFSEPYAHQAKALAAYLTRDRDLLVATGTGSGKTETFLFPILGGLAIEAADRSPTAGLHGCRALLLYPMNALVNDQVARLRKLFGNSQVADLLCAGRGRRVRFGMYTSRTPYPGKHDERRDKQILGGRLKKLFDGVSAEKRQALEKLGMWPTKDMVAFEESKFVTSPDDCELYTRHEMQSTCPDLLVTNYSMLEYMLLRPIEARLFEQTATWLNSDSRNYLTIVLDEAHMYRGASGAEVALLLRRLRSRLEARPSQLRFILTSASLGSSSTENGRVLQFAEDLTGTPQSRFEIVRSQLRVLDRASVAKGGTAAALVALDRAAFQTPLSTPGERRAVADALQGLARSEDVPCVLGDLSVETLRNVAFELCNALPVARHLANVITGTPTPSADLAAALCPDCPEGERAVDGLVTLATFGYSAREQRPFLPTRLHLLFRGLGGVYACVNAACTHRRSQHPRPILGRLFDTPRLRCECGARVYELLTHRRCGAAFLRGFWREDDEQFLWHEAPRDGGAPGERLIEVHLLAEPARCHKDQPDRTLWLHHTTGRLSFTEPLDEPQSYVMLQCAAGPVPNRRPPLISYDRQCPVCTREWTDETQIMDLQTKGEAPFAYLVREQVRLQPPTREPSKIFPNAGRKSLLFSDGRQRAARLARDIPRDVEKDSFRQLLVAAMDALNKLSRDAIPNSRSLYPAFLHVLSQYHLNFFDGNAAKEVERHVRDYERDFGNDLRRGLEEAPELRPPPQYTTALLAQLGSPYYSLFALTLGFASPRADPMRRIREALSDMDPALLDAVAIIWIQNFLDRFAFGDYAGRVRETAAGYSRPIWGETTGFREHQNSLAQRLSGQRSGDINKAMFKELCIRLQGHYVIDPNCIRLNLAPNAAWFQCDACTFLTPVAWQNLCPRCGKADIRAVDPESSPYLRSRKRLWRDPVTGMLAGTHAPFTLDVEEHTAQLGHRDPEDISSTTELFERRFRDVLIHDGDRPIDVLSCTTTMEVGIDIGSLVAVGLRNVPPQRQNYQQRAGRAGRRGSSLATVITYAQNNPHDNYYYSRPGAIISGPPMEPAVDTTNPKLIQRHVNAQLLQTFFHAQSNLQTLGSGVYSSWGKTWEFYAGNGECTATAFINWLQADARAGDELARIQAWLPAAAKLTGETIKAAVVAAVRNSAPAEAPNPPDDNLLEFFFSKAILPAYAFPRDLLSLRIEEHTERGIELEQQPQQGLHVALSEYAPGRFVVVNKSTYQIGAVTANRSADSVNRAAPLFEHGIRYVQCTNCYHTEELSEAFVGERPCRSCATGTLRIAHIIQPEVAYPRGAAAMNELSDEPVFTDVTAAQLPFPTGGRDLQFRSCGERADFAFGHNENLVVVNRGFDAGDGSNGFMVCSKCGHVELPGEPVKQNHQRDYDVRIQGRIQPRNCSGAFQSVFLGYTFPTDLLLLRIKLEAPFNMRYDVPVQRRPLVDAVRTLSEALAMAACRRLEIDMRELRSGFRFLEASNNRYADLFLFDALAGGAGYSTLAGQIIESLFDEAGRLLRECDCTSSCNKCLRTYENRTFQSSLNRFIAFELLNYARLGTVPQVPDISTQTLWLAPLATVLQLEGWTVKSTATVALEASGFGRRRDILCYPSLRDVNSLNCERDTVCVSRYDVENRLPNVFAQL